MPPIRDPDLAAPVASWSELPDRFLDDDAANALLSRTPRSAEHDLGLVLKKAGLAWPTLVDLPDF